MATTNSVLIASSLGLVMSGTFVGSALTLSTMVIPALLVSHPAARKEMGSAILGNATRSWQHIYDVGKRYGPMTGLIGSAAYAYAAYALPASSKAEKQLLLAAAVANSLVGPFTVMFMTTTNSELIRRAEQAKAGKGDLHQMKDAKQGSIQAYDTSRLLRRWSKLNASRAIYPLVAAACTAAALVRTF